MSIFLYSDSDASRQSPTVKTFDDCAGRTAVRGTLARVAAFLISSGTVAECPYSNTQLFGYSWVHDHLLLMDFEPNGIMFMMCVITVAMAMVRRDFSPYRKI